jgi:hypothetical protein
VHFMKLESVVTSYPIALSTIFKMIRERNSL